MLQDRIGRGLAAMALSAEQVESFETNGFTLIDTPLDEEQLQQAERGWCLS